VSQRPFNANSWLELARESKSAVGARVQDKSYKDAQASSGEFCPTQFLVPGWRGEGLIGRPAIYIKRLQEALWSDVRAQFAQLAPQANHSLKNRIHQEFLAFANEAESTLRELTSASDLWSHLHNENSPYKDELQKFTDVYSFRTATLFLYKTKLICTLAPIVETELTASLLANPNSFFAKIFQKGSSRELSCESLQQNVYSWYRPSTKLYSELIKLTENFGALSTTELVKISTYRAPGECTGAMKFEDDQYSHALSHKAFGLFVNSLLVFFPIWKKGLGFQYPQPIRDGQPDILSTKFVGDHLSSLSVSHWLAQENNCSMRWSEILCPDFSGDCFATGHYMKLCQELQFLAFLAHMARGQELNVIDLMARTMRERNAKSQDQLAGQGQLFSSQEVRSELLYDRVVINLNNLPKRNPHHHMLTMIQTHGESLTPRGMLYLFSSQKLFVPSQKDKVEKLLQDFKVEAHFCFEELKFKGEIPSYLYILSRRPDRGGQRFLDPFGNVMGPISSIKESCLSFRWHGQLNQFSRLQLLVDELAGFFSARHPSATPIYQNEVSDSLFFEFHQDAIFEGTLLSSGPKDPSRITHPNFFKNLTRSCSPLEQFYALETIDHEIDGDTGLSVTCDLLGIKMGRAQRFSLVLILDRTDPARIRLELISSDMYRAKLEQYGHACYDYFGLTPKKPGINVNLLREFFQSEIGNQLIQLSLNCVSTKVKSKLNTVLIPNFFSRQDELPEEFARIFSSIPQNSKDIQKTHPEQLRQQIGDILSHSKSACSLAPWSTLGHLCGIKHNLERTLVSFDPSERSSQIDFQNPLIMTPLVALRCRPLYPKNEDVFVDLAINDRDDLFLSLSSIHMRSDEESHLLELRHGDRCLVKLHSDPSLLAFIRFILGSAIGSPIGGLLSQLKIPSLIEFKAILGHYNELERATKESKIKITDLVGQLLVQHISGMN
jgi:hypothetical protein